MQARHRHKAKVQAKKEKEAKAQLESEQPGMYHHPSPFNTNPHWQEEITRGPSLPKKSSVKNSSQRGLRSSGGDSTAPNPSDLTNIGGSRLSMMESSTAIPEDDALSTDWNTRHGYQREDEELWGQSFGHNRFRDAISKASHSAGKLIESKLGTKEVTEQDRRDFYFAPKVPPVNDYHPPVISNKAPNAGAHQWMLQPPPPAKVMEGKIPVNRTTSSATHVTMRSRDRANT